MSPSNNFFSIFKASKAKPTLPFSNNNNQIKSNQDSIFQNSIFYEEFDPSLYSSSPSSTLSSLSTSSSTKSSTTKSSQKSNLKNPSSNQKNNQISILKRIQNYHQNQKELRKHKKELIQQEIDKSPYFIQTWYDPQPNPINSSSSSKKSSPISLVSYLPPIWVDEEIEEISNEIIDQTLFQEEEKEQCNPPLIIITSTEEEEDVSQQTLNTNRLPKQDLSFLSVPESLRRSRLTHYIPFTPKCDSGNQNSILLKNNIKQKDQRKIRFELGARLDPNEDCLLNFSHSIQSKRNHHYHQNKKCFHVRFIIGSKREESGPTITTTTKKGNENLKSCLKVKTQLDSLLIAAKNETCPKSILRKSSSSSKKSLKVQFDFENVSCYTVDRHIELAIEIRDRKMIRRVLREIKLEKRREFILTKPIEKWIDVQEEDEGLPRETDLEEEQEETVTIQKTEEERLQKRLKQFKLNNQSNQLAKLREIYQRKKHLMMLIEHLDFSNSITHKVRFEKEFNTNQEGKE